MFPGSPLGDVRLLALSLALALLASGCLGQGPTEGTSPVSEEVGDGEEDVPESGGSPTESPAPGDTPRPTPTVTPEATAAETGTPERVTLSLPFAPEDDPHGLLPMGETVSHGGDPHVGIDFFWDHRVNITASAPGEVIYVERRETGHVGTWDVFVRTGRYTVGYTEMGRVNPEIEVGDRVERGEYLGTNWNAIPEDDHWMIHWEFGYHSEGWRSYSVGSQVPHPQRLCPMTYFTEESRNRIQSVWEDTDWTWDGVDHKERFPYVCSGVFHGKDG